MTRGSLSREVSVQGVSVQGVSVPACTTGHMTRGSLSRGSLSKGSLSRGGVLCPGEGVSVQGRGSLSRGVYVWGFLSRGLCLGESQSKGSLSSGVSVSGVSVQGRGVSVWGVSVRETPHTVMSKQYASYWNAFLFFFICLHVQISGGKKATSDKVIRGDTPIALSEAALNSNSNSAGELKFYLG